MKPGIVFVDDEPQVLEGFRRMLSCMDDEWKMTFVSSADAALGHVHAEPYDGIVSDLRMPGKDGFELLAELRSSELTKDIPVIIVTGAGEHDLKRRALELGATDLLHKPVDREDLLARIQSMLRLKSAQDELKRHNAMLEQKVRERTAELEASRLEIIWRLAKAGEYRDEETGNHVMRVGCCCRVLAQELGMDRGFVELVFLTSPLHDIGKIGIPDRILMNTGKLSPEAWRTMQGHCAIGAAILLQRAKGMEPFLAWQTADASEQTMCSDNLLLEMAARIARGHHEWWDGSGYPDGLAGEDIPLEARIVAVADVYDALGSTRPYKPAYPEDKVLAVMREENGAHFDPHVFAAFERSLDEFRSIRAQYSDQPPAARQVFSVPVEG